MREGNARRILFFMSRLNKGTFDECFLFLPPRHPFCYSLSALSPPVRLAWLTTAVFKRIMARTFSAPTTARALDVAMFSAPSGLPATAFKRELEHRLMAECRFDVGEIPGRLHDLVRMKSWVVHHWRIL